MTYLSFTYRNNLKNVWLVLVFLLGVSAVGFGQTYTYTSKKNGSWTDPTTWQGGAVPLSYQKNTINIKHTLTVPGVGWQNDATINISDNGKIILAGSLTGNITLKCSQVSNTITINNGGNFGPRQDASLVIGNLIINNGGTFSGQGNVTFQKNANLIINSGGSFIPDGGIGKFNKVTVNSGAIFGKYGQIDFNNPTDSLIIESGAQVKITSNKNSFGTVLVKNGGSIIASNGEQTFYGPITVNKGGNFKITGGIEGIYYADVLFNGNVDFTGGGNHKIICAEMTINTNIDAHGGTLEVIGGRLIVNAGYILSGHNIKVASNSPCGKPGGLVVNGGMDTSPGGSITIDGSIEMGDNGTITGPEPKFDGDNRILIYHKTSEFTVGNEWKTDNNKIPTAVIVRMEKNAELKIGNNRTVGGDFSIESGSVKVVGNPTLIIQGDWIKNPAASFDPGKGTVRFEAGKNQIISSNGGQTVFYNLENNNNLISRGSGLQIKDTVSILNNLKLNPNSNTVLTDGSVITIKSGPDGTASMAPMSNATINYEGSGAFIIERYLDPTRKAWHFLSVPTDGSTFHQSWQEGNDSLKNVGQPGYGTMLTGTKGTIGYDYTSPQSSLRYFDPKTNQYVEIKNTAQDMRTYSGYMVFIRGDRSILPTNTSGYHPTVMRTKGRIYTGNTPKISIKAGEWALVGNPYPADIDFTKVLINGKQDQSSVKNTFYIWDASLAGSFGTGAFRTIQGNVSVPQKVGDKWIPSGYAFFVKNYTNDSIVLSIPETAKVVKSELSTQLVSNNIVSGINGGGAFLRVNFYNLSTGTPALLDGSYTSFQDGGLNSNQDVEKMTNPASENMSILFQNKVLTIQHKDFPTDMDTIQFKMNNYKVAPYRYEIIADKLDVSGQDAYLYDKFLNTFTPINPNGTTTYNFDVKGSPAGSWDETRFSVVFRPSKTTPVTITNVKAYTINADVRVEWQVENESNMENYTVEVSTDGMNFIAGGQINAMNDGAYTYHWLDVNPAAGYHYYRIASLGKEGKITYSKIVRVLVGSNVNASKITIYPNPIKGGIANLQFENLEAGTYQIRLLNTAGQVIMTKVIAHAGGSSSELLTLGTLTKGIYHLEVLKDGVRLMTEKVVY